MVMVEVAITGTFCEDGIDLRWYGLHAGSDGISLLQSARTFSQETMNLGQN